MKLYFYNTSTLEYVPVGSSKYVMLITILLASALLISPMMAPRVEVVETLTEVEKLIILDEENEFTREKFIQEIKSLNFRYPHIVFAQAVIESGNFGSNIFKENHNLFGMKQARIRANLAKGTNRSHAYYDNWKHSLYDYALYYSEYLSDIKSEEKYFEYINQRYAEDPNYDVKVRKLSAEYKNLFE